MKDYNRRIILCKYRNRKSVHVLLLVLTVLFQSNLSNANPPIELGRNQWLLTARLGTASLMGEMTKDFQFLDNEFRHGIGPSFDFSISRSIGRHWESGIGLRLNAYSGKNDLPEFSANGNHAEFMDLYALPTKYNVTSSMFYAHVRYFLKRFLDKSNKLQKWEPYVELNGGVNVFTSDLRYQSIPEGESSDVIFQKGKGRWPEPGAVHQFGAGVGTRYYLKNNMCLIASFNISFANYDFMDGVHNYNEYGERLDAYGIIQNLMVGVILPISIRRTIVKPYMPWAP